MRKLTIKSKYLQHNYILIGFLIVGIIVSLITTNFPLKVNASLDQYISEVDADPGFGYPTYVTKGPNGNLWITFTNGKIGQMTLNGELTLYPVSEVPQQITSGPDGNVWFTEYIGNKIGRITLNGEVTEYPLPADSNPIGITYGPDGNVWFTEYIGNKIGRITPNGVISEFYVQYGPHGITKGPDGNLWYTAFDTNQIGKITPSGNIIQYNLPQGGGKPEQIIAGADGNMWFTESSGNKIGRITTNGLIKEFSVPTINSFPNGIVAGPDGNIWFTETEASKVGRITTNGNFNEFDTLSSNSQPTGITVGQDNNIWFAEKSSKKLGRIDLVGVPSITPIPTSLITPTITPTPTPQIDLKDYKQTDPQWGSARLDNSSNCGNMYTYGCAVTAVADVFYSYGKTVLSSMQLNPGTLNNWLASHNGFSGCAIIWANASAATSLGAPSIKFRNGQSNWVAGQQAIDQALSEGNLPIIGINTSFGTHFLPVSAKLPDVNGKPDYRIVDPALYPFVQNSVGKTGQSLSQAYGGFDKVFEYVIYRGGSLPQRSLTIRAHSPVQLLVTNDLGDQTGYDESTQDITENIPESTYGVEPGIAPTDGSSPQSGEVKYFQQIDPTDGEYTVALIGTGQGSYVLDVSKTDENGNASTQVLKGFAQQGVTETYHIQYTGDATVQPVLKREVTFGVLKTDITNLFNQGQIKNKLLYLSLKLQAELAEKESKLPIVGKTLAILDLKLFESQLSGQRGKQITEDGYKILFQDAETLISSLRGSTSNPTPTPTLAPTPTPTPKPGGS